MADLSINDAQPDRLATLTQGSTTTTYTYDGDGLRLQASTGAQAAKKTNFEFDVNGALPALVAERDGSGGLVRRYLNGLATISMTAGTKTAYYAYDGLGSVVNLTSSAGATWWTYAYLPFGGVRSATKNSNQATDNVLRFAGGYLDPTTLYHFGARQYDPGAGRFLSTDPMKPSIADPYVGAYLYANNNPVRYTDPSGRCIPAIVAGAEAGAALGFVAPGPGNLAGAAGGASVGFALCLGAIAIAFLGSFVEWPLTPTGTLQEPPFVNVGPQPGLSRDLPPVGPSGTRK